MVQSEGVAQLDGLLAERTVRIDASPETVFRFLVDAEKMLMWMGVKTELDPRPGGIIRVEVTPGWLAVGEYTEVDPPRSVAFTWGWQNGPLEPGSTLVRLTLEPDGDATILTLVHSGLPDEEAVRSHDDGWQHFLGRLEVAAAGGDPGPDPWAADGGESS